MPDGRISYVKRDGYHVFRYSGRIDYTLAPAVGRFVDTLIDDSWSAQPFLFDLRRAKLIDSTNLGLLARVAERVRLGKGGSCRILSDSDEITDVLLSMGFDEIFEITSTDAIGAAAGEETLIAGDQPYQGDLLRTMLEAHQTLAGLNERDRDQFKDVVQMLEAQMRAR